MEVEKNEYYTQVKGSDINGEFNIEIQNDCSQLRIETGDSEAYIDVNFRELKTIRDSITSVLDAFGKADA